MKILLCGSNGRLGGEIVYVGSLLNISIVAYNASQLDITSPNNIALIFAEIKPDIVINAAAYTNIEGAEANPELAYQINSDGPAFLARYCSCLDIPLIHVSTDYVFSGNKKAAYNEDDKTNPVNIYGKSKLKGEEAIISACNKYIIIRSSWLFGQKGDNFVKTIIKKAIDGLPLSVVTNEIGCPTSTLGLANCILKIATQVYQGNLRWGIYHFCGFPEINRFQYATEIINVAKTKYKLKTDSIKPLSIGKLNNKVKRPGYSAMATNKIFNIFNIFYSKQLK